MTDGTGSFGCVTTLRRILRALGAGPATLEELQRATRMRRVRLRQGLARMAVAGQVTREAGHGPVRYALVRRG